MSKLGRALHQVDCTLEGYEGEHMLVWINAPNGIFREYARMVTESQKRDEKGNIVYRRDEDGELLTDDELQPIPDVDEDKVTAASRYFVSTLLVQFSINEDLDGNPLLPTDEDFVERLPEDLLAWVINGITEAIQDRRERAKKSAKLQGITTQR